MDMIVLRKKRLLLTAYLILACVFVSVYTVSSQKEKKTDAVLVSALPVSEKVIVIDAGHGVPDEGAQSSSRNNRS